MTEVLTKADDLTTVHLAFLRTVATIGRLAGLVHTYHLPNITLCDGDVKTGFPYLVRSALQGMVNLRELWVGLQIGEIGPSSCIFEGCKFQLESLRLGLTCRPGEFAPFLEGQRELRQLTVNFRSDAQDLSISVCPNIKLLQGNRHAIDALLPQLNVRTLIYSPDTYEMNESLAHLSGPLGQLQVLSLGGHYMRPSLHVLAPFLTSLEYLELVSLHVSRFLPRCRRPELMI